jgi:hypothetical protein
LGGEVNVREWADVKREAKAKNKTVNMGRVFEIAVEKNAELEKGHPNRKFKGRVDFAGNNVIDQNHDHAIFAELNSCPATIEASKATDLYGLLPGHSSEMADGDQAYTQSKLGGTDTWIVLPPERRPAAWAGMVLPVCLLLLALYGHPDSGGYWEKHCEKHLNRVGFVHIGSEWSSCFWHPELLLFLIVYVDDFKMSGPTANLAIGWELTKKGIHIKKPVPTCHFLGCTHEFYDHVLENGVVARGDAYNMESFLVACVNKYIEDAGSDVLPKVATPFL